VILDVTSVSVENLIEQHKTALAIDRAPMLASISRTGAMP
jgi:hypothetical protein